jgi:hypothetical protein
MHISRRVTTLAIGAAALGTAVAVTSAALRVADGLTFTYTMSSARAAANPKDPAGKARSMTSLVRMAGGAVRMDVREGVTPFTGPGGYMILRGEPSRVEFVNPEKKEVLVMPATAMGGTLGALTNNPLIKMKTSNEKFDFEDLGPGETILGYKTRHVRITSGQTMEMRVLLSHTKSTSETTMDAYVAPGLAVDDETGRVWIKNFASGLKTTNPDLLGKMEAYAKGPGRGIMLKATSYTKDSDDKGKTTYDTVSIQVTDLKRGPIDDSVFTYPHDYKVQDMTAGMEAVQAGVDSANKAAAADSAKKSEDKPSLKKGLKGLLKKP